jgi:thiosulfate reductase cytochrome b subunit
MVEEKSLHVLEGLGYCAAVLIGVSGLGDSQALRLFHVAGLIIALVVIVRLLSMSIAKGGCSSTSAADIQVASGSEEENKEEVTR